jgi:hypothetical protein
MVRNALHTPWAEARALTGWELAAHLLLQAGPPLLLSRIDLVARALAAGGADAAGDAAGRGRRAVAVK